MKTNTSWVLVTGASSGFGEEFARQYAERGHSLVLVARRLDRLEKLAEELRRQFGVEVVVEGIDLTDIEAVSALHQRLRDQGIEIEILINNAGHGLQGWILAEEAVAQERAVTTARHAARLSNERYRNGIVSHQEALQAERAKTQPAGQRLIRSAQLVKSLGGGW